jgi:fructose-1-phosphate kinase PfkB-like protein
MARDLARDLVESGGSELVIVTLGEAGAVAAGADGALYRLPPLTVDVVSTAGAGDAFSAGVVAGLDEGRSVTDALRLALAASAATVAHAGTGECDPALVAALYERARCLNPES